MGTAINEEISAPTVSLQDHVGTRRGTTSSVPSVSNSVPFQAESFIPLDESSPAADHLRSA